MNKNFLNNQNYILWKTEKKKLLSKFFVENLVKNVFMILGFFEHLIIDNIMLLFMIFFLLFLFFIWIYVNSFVLIIFSIFFLIMFYLGSINEIKDYKKSFFVFKSKQEKYIKDYFILNKNYNIFFRLKIINILFFPFLFIVLLYLSLFSLIYTFVFRWIKWYNFIKNTLKQNLIEKFDSIEKVEAENRYYKVKLKV